MSVLALQECIEIGDFVCLKGDSEFFRVIGKSDFLVLENGSLVSFSNVERVKLESEMI
ncbi:MAG: hypothetical protein QXL17_02850 [Candidatus Thermoplasmatota archaeon]